MTWPTTPGFVKTNLDASSDDPAAARADLHNLATDVENIISGRAQASGVASLGTDTKIPKEQLPFPNPIPKVVAWQTSGSFNWTVPTGCFRIFVECWGAGGGGGYGNSTTLHGGGGGAGGGALKSWNVTPGDTANIVVGAGGQGGLGPTDANGADGANSTVTINATSVTGNGGIGGQGGGSRFGGAGGTASGGDVNLEGGTAMSGIGSTGMGGFGGCNSRSGQAPGQGVGWGFGGGGYGSGTNGPNPAASGKAGGVLIWYYEP